MCGVRNVFFFRGSASVDREAGCPGAYEDLPRRAAEQPRPVAVRGCVQPAAAVSSRPAERRAVAADVRQDAAAAQRRQAGCVNSTAGMQHDPQAQGDSATC